MLWFTLCSAYKNYLLPIYCKLCCLCLIAYGFFLNNIKPLLFLFVYSQRMSVIMAPFPETHHPPPTAFMFS